MMDTGVFDDGPEPMLWRPDLDHDRLRRQRVLESIVVEPLPFALIGVTIGLLIGGGTGLAIAAAILALSWWWAVAGYRCWGLDCARPGFTRHRQDRGGGEWFYRPGDFHALPADGRRQVDRIFAALPAFDGDALAWLRPDHRTEVNRIAWDLLDCLHRSLPARAVLARMPADLAGDPGILTARHELVLLDRDVADAVDALCEAAAVVHDLNLHITRPARRDAVHADLQQLRLPTAPTGAAELRDEIHSHARVVDEVLDLAEATP